MKYKVSLIAIIVLSGCWSSSKPHDDFPLIWNPTVGMAATSRFDAALFSGDWIVREGFDDDWGFDQFNFDVLEGSTFVPRTFTSSPNGNRRTTRPVGSRTKRLCVFRRSRPRRHGRWLCVRDLRSRYLTACLDDNPRHHYSDVRSVAQGELAAHRPNL